MKKESLCPRFEKALETLSKRWNALIVFQLLSGPQRFGEIEAALNNLSGKVLSERLKELEAEGVVRREVYPEMPVRIEYSLTDKGRALAPVFAEISKWSSTWISL
ncbi:winged helix-turn-helix transcriptional regulator [Paenibacillus beijingensis]|uniref:MarR family transcriptional regulator n=1 Tax=Paenibacillus beijingensis TaxID=1126833 RepID=A0A0D5NJ90_9BACL|nr:winged helix-turn-helix transcriptional regulator [Paenibacillus beijingensis]AJY75444.1 MarR family transcriptional regulator [Paenibacillus beijingensis]